MTIDLTLSLLRCRLKIKEQNLKSLSLFFFLFFSSKKHVKWVPSRCTVSKGDLSWDRKIYCLQACVSMFRPQKFMGYDSERAKSQFSATEGWHPKSITLVRGCLLINQYRRNLLFQALHDSSDSNVTCTLSCVGVQRKAIVTQASVTSGAVLTPLTAWWRGTLINICAWP